MGGIEVILYDKDVNQIKYFRDVRDKEDYTMKGKLKRTLAVFIAMVTVLSTMTTAFARPNYNNDNNGTYTHMDIAIETENADENGGYYLEKKPVVTYKTYMEVTVCNHCGDDDCDGEHCNECDDNDCDGWHGFFIFGKDYGTTNYGTTTTKTAVENSVNYTGRTKSQKNGWEYISSHNYKFTTDTVFHVKATLTNGVDEKEVEFDIYDVPNYKNSGYSFYKWCAKNNCDDSTGIDIKLTYEEIAELFLNVKYSVDEDYTKVTDENSYEVEAGVTVKEAPAKEGFTFVGWDLVGDDSDKLYQAGDKVAMVEGGLEFVAVYSAIPEYTITYKVDGNTVCTKTVKAGTDISDFDSYIYAVEDESKEFSGWTVETADVNLESVDKDVVITATTSTKTFTVTYKVDGETVKTETVDYGTVIDLSKVEYTPDVNKTFLGWDEESVTVKSDMTINGSTEVKTFTVTYKVDGVTVYEEKFVEYGSSVAVEYDGYTLPENKEFAKNWSVTEGNANEITSDVVIEATTQVKTFTVTFKAEDGTVISEKVYEYGAQADEEAAPKKADLKIEDETGATAASWTKYSFDKWVADGDYTTDDLVSVTEDMTFTASYKANQVKVMYYVLNRDLEQPSELASYPSANYSKGVAGTISKFEKVANNDALVAERLVDAPSAEDFGIQLKDGETIKWYVIKSESDGWHVDGIIANQKYTLTVNYVDAATGETVAETVTEQVAATTEYSVESPVIEGYDLAEGSANVVAGTMPYGNVTVTVEYDLQYFDITYVVYDKDGNASTVDTIEVPYGTEFDINSVDINDYMELDQSVEFSGWSLMARSASNVVTVTSDIVVSGQISTKVFNVTYYLYDEQYGETQVVEYGSALELIGAPEADDLKDSDNFVEWTVAYGDIDNVTSDVVIVGATEVKTFTVTYAVDGEVVNVETGIPYGSAASAYEYEVPAGYDFSGFAVAGEGDVSNVTTDITLEGTLTVQQYNLTINYVDSEGNALVDSVETVVDAFEGYIYESPVMEGYELNDDAQAVVSGTMPCEDVVINVVYNQLTYTVTYFVDGVEYTSSVVPYGTVVNVDDVVYNPAGGFSFSGWRVESGDVSKVTADVTIVGKTAEIVIEEEEIIPEIPLAPSEPIVPSQPETDAEPEEDVEIDVPFAPGEPETDVEPETEVQPEEEEDVEMDIPFASGTDSGDSSNVSTYVTILLLAAVAALVSAYIKKMQVNE